MASRFLRIIQVHFGEAVKTYAHQKNVRYVMDPEDIRRWYVRVRGLGAPNDGDYIFQLDITDKYPHEPPLFKCLTPSGVFVVDANACVSIGTYHKGAYSSTLGAVGFFDCVLGLFMTYTHAECGGGIGILDSVSARTRASAAKASRAYNAEHHGYILALFASLETSEDVTDAAAGVPS